MGKSNPRCGEQASNQVDGRHGVWRMGGSLFRPGCVLLLDEGAVCEPTGLSVAYSLALDT